MTKPSNINNDVLVRDQFRWAFSEKFGFDGYDYCKRDYEKLLHMAHNCKKFCRNKKCNRVWYKWQRIAIKYHLKIKNKRYVIG